MSSIFETLTQLKEARKTEKVSEVKRNKNFYGALELLADKYGEAIDADDEKEELKWEKKMASLMALELQAMAIYGSPEIDEILGDAISKLRKI
jgi:hypothetical protein